VILTFSLHCLMWMRFAEAKAMQDIRMSMEDKEALFSLDPSGLSVGLPLENITHKQTNKTCPGLASASSSTIPKYINTENQTTQYMQCSVQSKTAWGGGRSDVGVLGGKFYYEVTCAQVLGTVRVGFSTMAASRSSFGHVANCAIFMC
jgi:hypothetical protein